MLASPMFYPSLPLTAPALSDLQVRKTLHTGGGPCQVSGLCWAKNVGASPKPVMSQSAYSSVKVVKTLLWDRAWSCMAPAPRLRGPPRGLHGSLRPRAQSGTVMANTMSILASVSCSKPQVLFPLVFNLLLAQNLVTGHSGHEVLSSWWWEVGARGTPQGAEHPLLSLQASDLRS